MPGETFVYRTNAFCINELYVYGALAIGPDKPSESLVESGLRHRPGKTFRCGTEDGSRTARRLRL
jgi:hypothetical protein